MREGVKAASALVNIKVCFHGVGHQTKGRILAISDRNLACKENLLVLILTDTKCQSESVQ